MTSSEKASGPRQLKKLEIVDGKINYRCLKEKCPESCCGPFGGVQRGIDSVDGRSFAEIVLTTEDSDRLLANGCAHLTEMLPDRTYRMRLHDDGSCTAFIDGRCSIHRIKPTICRAFPFYIDMFVGLCGVTACSGFGEGWTKLKDLSSERLAAREMYTYWERTLTDASGEEAKEED